MSEKPSEDSPEMAPEGAGASLVRTAKIAVLLVIAIVGGVATWIWTSSSEDANLPFEYEGFD